MLLETDRTYLRKINEQDIAFIINLMNSPSWLHFIGDRKIDSEENALRYIKDKLIKSYQTHGYGFYVVCIKENDEPLGISGFVLRDYLDHPDVGFAILPKHEGKGYMKEATLALLKYAYEHLRFSTLYAITTNDNKRSIALLQKIGLTFEKMVKPPKENREFMLFINNKPAQ
ncbi:GNAT family N-acetyltransferase [Flavobacteriaceae bacterium M23B6Z8]